MSVISGDEGEGDDQPGDDLVEDIFGPSSEEDQAEEEVKYATRLNSQDKLQSSQLSQKSRQPFTAKMDGFIRKRWPLSKANQPKPSEFCIGVNGKTGKQCVDRWRTLKKKSH
eukprot:scpid100879/ scgid7631/ 